MKCLCKSTESPEAQASETCLGQLWVFQDLPPTAGELMAARANRRQFAAGRTIFARGEAVEEIFLLKSGRVRLSLDSRKRK